MVVSMSIRPSLDILLQYCLLYTVEMTTYPEKRWFPKAIFSDGYCERPCRNSPNLLKLPTDIGVGNEQPLSLSMSKPEVETSRRKLLKLVDVFWILCGQLSRR